jgi:zinc transporter, ZIP family
MVMSSAHILVLGAIAGLTIFIGLPVARLRNPALRLKAFLSSAATGILIFLLWDVLTHASEPVESSLTSAAQHGGSWLHFVGLATVFAACFSAGLLSLVHYESWTGQRRAKSMLGPGAASVAEFEPANVVGLTPARQLALFIAIGIGLHNFAEGLAIGQSAAGGEITLAVALIVGFGLHNATEGFGVVAPMSGEPTLPSWGFLAFLGLIAGGPTFLGTLVGQAWVSDALSIAFLTLAAGSILYVVIELLNVNRGFGFKRLVTWGLVVGVLAGFATDWVLVAAGA